MTVVLFYILLFFLGAAMGSFAGVILERGREDLSWKNLLSTFGGRSYCPSCRHTLTPDQLIPLIGWVSQGGKCKFCKSGIPQWYVWIELAMGTLFVVTFGVLINWDIIGLSNVLADNNWYYLSILSAILLLNRVFLSLIIADLLWYELHLIMWLIGVLVSSWLLFLLGGVDLFIDGLIYSFFFTLVYLGIYWFGRWWMHIKTGEIGEGMGQGDIFLASLLGLLSVLWPSQDVISFVQLVCWFLVVSSVFGALYRLSRVLITGDKNQMLPFIPAMIGSWYILFLRGDKFLLVFG